MTRVITTIYMGPIKIEPIVELREGLFVLKDPVNNQVLGYPARNKPFQIFYSLGHLPTITQALIRGHKNLRCIVIWRSGQTHEGPILYDNEYNSLVSVVK